MSSRPQLPSLILVLAVTLPLLALGPEFVARDDPALWHPGAGALVTSSSMTLTDPRCVVNCNASTLQVGSTSHLEINVSQLGIPFVAFRVTVTNVDVNASGRLRFIIYGGTSGGFEFNTTYLNTSQINSQDVPPMAPNGTDNVTLVLTPLNSPDFVIVQSEWFYVGLFDVLQQPATQDVIVINFPGPPAAPSSPSAPRLLQAGAGDRVVILTWQTPASSGASAITNYRVYRGTTSGGETLLTSLGVVLTDSDTGVMDGMTYYYEVSAVSSAGEGPKSNETFATPRGVPSAPLGLTGVAGNAEVTLSWQAPASDGGSTITNHSVYRGTSSGGETLLTSLGTVLTYVDPGLAKGQTYYYEVTATNSLGEGPKSAEVSAMSTAPPDVTPPTIMITSQANNTEVSSTSVTVSGTAADNVVVAEVEVSTDGVTWTTASGTTAWNAHVTLHAGSNTIYVRATDAAGNQATTRVTVMLTSTTSGASGLPLPLIGGFGVVVVLVGAATAFIVSRWRRRSGGPPTG